MYFYRLLGYNSFDISNYDDKAYLNNDYFASFNNLSLLMRKAKLTEAEKKFVIKTCFEEWKLIKEFPNSKLKASGEAVGLPKGQMGNSEVGHIKIGAGKR